MALHFDKPLADMIADQQRTNKLEILPIMLAHALVIGALPLAHRDPFDRLLIAQAKADMHAHHNFSKIPIDNPPSSCYSIFRFV